MKLSFGGVVHKLFCINVFTFLLSSAQAQNTPSPTPAGQPASVPTPATPAISYSAVHVQQPIIAMTFDDGPSEKLTPELLDLLAERHIHATFFVIGQNAQDHPEILQRALKEGHEIGNHSWSHPAFGKMRDEAVRNELRKTDQAIQMAIGKRPVLMRPPYGSITTRQKQWIHSEFGYSIILWDVDPLDWKRPGPSVVANRIVRQTRAGSIILAHDIHPGTIKAMPAVFDQLRAKGFQFVTVSELISLGKPMPAQHVKPDAMTSTTPQASIALPSPVPSLTKP